MTYWRENCENTCFIWKSEVEVEVPDDSTVIEPQNIEALEDYTSAIQNVLRHPTGSKPLKRISK